MDWRDEGVVIGVRRHGETSVILELLTESHGRHLGVVRGGRSRRLRATLQPGNGVLASWYARLDEHLGSYTVEACTMRAGQIMGQAARLHALNHLCGLSRLLPERDPHPGLYRAAGAVLDAMDDQALLPVLLVRLELAMLAELGFGLDLDRCAVTASQVDLAFVSPRTGRAVSRAAGEAYRDRILRLPRFLAHGSAEGITDEDLRDAFRVTEHFLNRDVFAARGLAPPVARQAYLAAVLPASTGASAQTGRSAVRLTP